QKEQSHNTGVAHLLAVSGLHIGMIALALEFLCKCCFLKKTRRRLSIIGLLFFYIGAIGFPPSAVRAWMMLVCFWVAPVLNRKSSGMSSLLCSALLALIHNPMTLFDIGFQLSYGVVAMILLCSGPSLVSVSVAATLASAPLTFEYFSMFSLVGIFINPLVVQLAMPAVASGFLFLLGSLCGENRLSDICFGIARGLTKILELFLNSVEQWMPWHIEWATKPRFLGLLTFLCFLVIGFWISWYAQFRQWCRVHAEKR
ncbi:MAG: ComEC/Rec2 family competence protein, partial [Opitutales bacterium]|nr:ComEC/Rec2 family competence protein [Opitutales bacterium]